MKFFKRLILSSVILLSFSYCELMKLNNKPGKDDTLTFVILAIAATKDMCFNGHWIQDVSTGNYNCIKTNLVASADNIEIYEQEGIDAEYYYSDFRYSTIASEFNSKINPKMTSFFGTPTDIDSNKKITIVVADIGSGVAGFVDPINFLVDSPSDGLRSNQKEVIYMDGVFLLEIRKKDLSSGRPDTFLSTLTHEYQHLIRFKYEIGFTGLIRTLNDITNKDFTMDDTWIDEGTSEVASDIAGYGPQYSRMACFRGDPSVSCGQGVAGFPLFEWRSSIRNYSISYAFMNYLFLNSGSNDTDRATFMKNNIQGNSSSVRAATATKLMTLFKGAAKYDSTVLSQTESGIFGKLYAAFLSQSFNPDRYPKNSSLFIGSTLIGDMNALYNAYPLPDVLKPLYTYPSNMAIVKGNTFLIDPSIFYRVSEASATAPTDSNTVKVYNNNPSGYGPEFIIFNGSISSSAKPVTSSGVFWANRERNSLKYLQPGFPEEILTCSQDLFKQREKTMSKGSIRKLLYSKLEN